MENETHSNTSSFSESFEDGILEWTRCTFIGFMVLVAIIGIPGNAIVVTVLSKFRDKSTTDVFVLVMSGMDLFSASVNTTCFIVRYEPTFWKFLASVAFCDLHIFSICLTNISTTFLLTAVALDRYRKAKATSTREAQSASTKAKGICVGVMISSFVYSTVYLFTVTLDSNTLKCVLVDDYRILAAIFSGILAFVFGVMFLTVIVCYTKISILLWKNHRQLFKMEIGIVNNETNRKCKLWNRKSRIRPLNDDVKISDTSTAISTQNCQPHNLGKATTAFQDEPRCSNEQTIRSETPKEIKEERRERKSCITRAEDEIIFDQSNRKHSGTCVAPSQSKAIHINAERPKHTLHSSNRIERDRKQINVTTLMVFLVTLIYISTWVVKWTTLIYKTVTNTPSLRADFLTERLYMINCMTSPIFYIVMSSKFRQKARELFHRT